MNQPQANVLPVITTLLPLFYEKEDSPAMIKFGMDVINQVTAFLNPGQVPIITVDQPLFALAKVIQWKWPIVYGEGLHLETTMWNSVGDRLDGSGWTNILTEANMAPSGERKACLRLLISPDLHLYFCIIVMFSRISLRCLTITLALFIYLF